MAENRMPNNQAAYRDIEARMAAWVRVGLRFRELASASAPVSVRASAPGDEPAGVMPNPALAPLWAAACHAATTCQPFFTIEDINYATLAWGESLRAETLRTWYEAEFGLDTRFREATVAVVMAGNLPWVGLHDVLSVLLSGCRLLLKPSAKDRPLWEFWHRHLWPFPDQVRLADDLKGADFDAVIATGSDNTRRYFDYHFRHVPTLLRSHRISCAVLKGDESTAQLSGLWHDMLRYFGMGCRSVSVLWVPQHFDWARFIDLGRREGWHKCLENETYAHNYHYRKALFDMQGQAYQDGGCVLFEQAAGQAAPPRASGVASVAVQTYRRIDQAWAEIAAAGAEAWQCVVTEAEMSLPKDFRRVPLGKAQCPTLFDYADGVSIPGFLRKNFAI